MAAARGVGDPVLAAAVDRADALVAHHEAADVAPRLRHILLDVEDRVLVRAQHVAVLEDGLGGVAVVDLAHHPAPRAHHGLEHHRVAHPLDRFQCAFGRERQQAARGGHASVDQRLRGEEFVAAGGGDVVRVHRRHARVAEQLQHIQRPAVLDAALQHNVERELGLVQVEDLLAVIHAGDLDPAPFKLGKQQLLLGADARAKHGNMH